MWRENDSNNNTTNQEGQEDARPIPFIGLRIGRQREEELDDRATLDSDDDMIEEINKWNATLSNSQFTTKTSFPPLRRPHSRPTFGPNCESPAEANRPGTPTFQTPFRPIPKLNRGGWGRGRPIPLYPDCPRFDPSIHSRINQGTYSRAVVPKMSTSQRFNWRPAVEINRATSSSLPNWMESNEENSEDEDAGKAKKKRKLSQDSDEEVENITSSAEKHKFLLSEVFEKVDSSDDSNEGFEISSDKRLFAQGLIFSTITKRTSQASKDESVKENNNIISKVEDAMEIN